MSQHKPLPWSYRPDHYDDWGWIRAADGSLACIARGDDGKSHDQHRIDKTDPYGPNALLIIEAVNNHDRLLKAMKAAKRLIGAINDSAPAAVKESNINMAWHILDENLKAAASETRS